MLVKNPRETKQNGTSIELVNSTTLSGGSYTFEFLIKGDYEEAGISAGFGTNTHPVRGNYLSLTSNRFSTSDTEGWTKYSATLTYTVGDAIHIAVTHGCSEVLIDNVAVKDSSGVNLLSNGDFEAVTVETITIPKGNDFTLSSVYSEKYPHSVIVNINGSRTGIAWINASAQNIAKVLLYDVQPDGEVLINDELSKTSGGVCNLMIEDVNAEISHVYKIVTEFSDGTKTEYFADGTETKNNAPMDWISNFNAGANGTLYYVPATLRVDENVAHSGEASLKYSFISPSVSNLFVNITQGIPLELGKKYFVSFWMRGENAGAIAVRYGWGGFDGVGDYFIGDTPTYGWKHIEATLTYEELRNGQELMITSEQTTEGLWIDDIEIFELDENGEKTGENLVKNGSFENFTSEEPFEVKEISGVGEDMTATLSWTQSGEPFDTRLYLKEDERFIQIGQFGASNKTITIRGLENERDYVFGISNIGASGLESEIKTCTIRTVSPDFRVGNPIVNDSEGLKTGVNNISVKVNNYKVSNGFNAELIAVLRKGQLIVDKDNMAVSVAMGDDEILTASVTAPDMSDGEYTLSVYVWDGFSMMNILKPHSVFSES